MGDHVRALSIFLVGCAVVLAAGGCSGGGGAVPDGGGAGTGGGPAAFTCQQIRLCVTGTPCASEGCVQGCLAKGSPAAQTAFAALHACTAALCAIDDANYTTCACNEQCFDGSSCLAEVDACLAGAAADDICDNICH